LTLAEACRGFPIEVRRQAEITSLGFVEVPLDGRLVFALSEGLLQRGRAVGGVSAVLTRGHLAHHVGQEFGLAIADDPRRMFVEVHNRLVKEGYYGPLQASSIDATARVRPGAIVSPTGITIGPHCEIAPGAILEPETVLAADVRILPGAVLGSDGFQTMRFDDAMIDIHHAGSLEVGARTVVMANAVLARAVFRQATRIGSDCRIGNGAFVSHNVQIGDRTLIGHGAVIAGNCTIGSDVTIGPGAICLDRLEIADRAYVTAGSVVTRCVGAGERVTGNFAIPHDLHVDFVKKIASRSS
jgi:acetyltransferase-like isoleucine patch superfamily enzyme